MSTVTESPCVWCNLEVRLDRECSRSLAGKLLLAWKEEW
jgi:hypothetical protein